MNNQFFHNPHNLLGKLAQLATFKQFAILLLILLSPAYLLLTDLAQTYQENKELQLLIQQKSQDITHQQHILTSLQQTTQNTFTPEITSQIAQINHELQQYSSIIKNSQWTFYSFPQLNIQITGNFSELYQFLTEFLVHQAQLNLLQMRISKIQETDNAPQILHAEFHFKLSVKG